MNRKSTGIVIFLVLIIVVAALSSIFLYNEEHGVNESKIQTDNSIAETISIEDFREKLEENDIVIDSETENQECDLIGAAEGVSYKIDDLSIQVYRFDLDSSDELTIANLKKAEEEEKVVMPSFNDYEFKVKYNKSLILINSEDHPQGDKIVEIFESL